MQNEQENIELLRGMMGNDLSADVARRVLLKHKGDIQAAASAMLEGDTGEDMQLSFPANFDNPGVPPTRRPNTPCTPECKLSKPLPEKDIIDLSDDPELSRALQMSLEQPALRPSTRAPDPNWAVVPSNVPVGTTLQEAQSQEDQSLNQAIEASLSASYNEDRYEDLPPEEKIRKVDQPVSLRTRETELYFTTLVLHALFHVPQVREQLAGFNLNCSDIDQYNMGYPGIICKLLALFTFMDLTKQSYIPIDGLNICSSYNGRKATSATDLPGDLSHDFYGYLARAIESEIPRNVESQCDRLFFLRYAPTADSRPSDPQSHANAFVASSQQGTQAASSEVSFAPVQGLDTCCVRVDVRGADEGNDLLTCLSNQLGLSDPGEVPVTPGISMPQPQSLVKPSDVVAFQLVRLPQSQTQAQKQTLGQTSPQSSSSRTPFLYPKYVYLDQFLRENSALTVQKRSEWNQLQKQIKELVAKKESIANFKGKDTLRSLKSTLYYFENVASKDGPPLRAEQVKNSALTLRKTVVRVENEIQSLDSQIAQSKSRLEKVFDDPQLQNHRYDLRAVLVHDGFFGRNHIYSYVQYKKKWWKTLDANVTEVSQDAVLNDTTGLHLGAGPYMLIYSRATPEKDVRLSWPSLFKDACQKEYEEFLHALESTAPQVAARLREVHKSSSVPATADTNARRRSMSAMSVVESQAGISETAGAASKRESRPRTEKSEKMDIS